MPSLLQRLEYLIRDEQSRRPSLLALEVGEIPCDDLGSIHQVLRDVPSCTCTQVNLQPDGNKEATSRRSLHQQVEYQDGS